MGGNVEGSAPSTHRAALSIDLLLYRNNKAAEKNTASAMAMKHQQKTHNNTSQLAERLAQAAAIHPIEEMPSQRERKQASKMSFNRNHKQCEPDTNSMNISDSMADSPAMSPVNKNLVAPRPTATSPNNLILSMAVQDVDQQQFPDDGPDQPKQDSQPLITADSAKEQNQQFLDMEI